MANPIGGHSASGAVRGREVAPVPISACTLPESSIQGPQVVGFHARVEGSSGLAYDSHQVIVQGEHTHAVAPAIGVLYHGE